MKSTSPAGVALAILAAAGVGAVTTWTLMRQQPVVVVFAQESGQARRPASVEQLRGISSPQEKSPKQIIRIAPSNPVSMAATSQSLGEKRDHQIEPRQEGSFERSSEPAAVVYRNENTAIAQQATQLVFNSAASPRTLQPNAVGSQFDDALSFALEAASLYVKEGFTVREDYWGGDLAVKTQKAIVHQLFRGNEYWFWMGTNVQDAKISVHIYDSDGNLGEVEAWSKPPFAAARVVPESTGSYYLIVEVEKSDRERTPYALAYGFR